MRLASWAHEEEVMSTQSMCPSQMFVERILARFLLMPRSGPDEKKRHNHVDIRLLMLTTCREAPACE